MYSQNLPQRRTHVPATLDRLTRFSQTTVVGAVSMALAGLFFVATVVLLLSLWIPAWVATLTMTALLTVVSLAIFASAEPGSHLRNLDFDLPFGRKNHEADETKATSVSGVPAAEVTPDVSEPVPDTTPEGAEPAIGVDPAIQEDEPAIQEEEPISVEPISAADSDRSSGERIAARPPPPPLRTTGSMPPNSAENKRRTEPMFRKTTQPSSAR